MQLILQSPTPNISQSKGFYEQLGFELLESKGERHFFSDGTIVVEINEERTARLGLKLYRSDWSELIKELEMELFVKAFSGGYLTNVPSSVWVYFIEKELGLKNASIEKSILGNNGGISLEVIDIKKALAFWQKLGFEAIMGGEEQGWVALQDKYNNRISLLAPLTCPHLFYNPSINYFNGKDNLVVIDQIRKIGISITEEITHFNKEGNVDNVMLRDPGGLGFFVFSD